MSEIKEIILLDDHSLYLQGLSDLIEKKIENCKVHAFGSVAELMQSFSEISGCGLLISDIELPGENVFDFFETLSSKKACFPVLVISMHKKLSVIRKCKNMGVAGYLLKDDDELLEEAITVLLNGGTFYSPRVEEYYQSFAEVKHAVSPREEDIIKMICKGFSNAEIAEALFITIETVKSHKKNIKQKLNCKDSKGLIEYGNKHLML